MSCGQDFVDTLKRIRYPKAKKLDATTFDWMFTQKQLIPFLKSFCTLTEENVITEEELAKYESLTPEDFDQIQLLEEKQCLDDDDIRKEMEFLKAHLECIEKQNMSLENEKDLLKSHESALYHEIDEMEATHARAHKSLQELQSDLSTEENELREILTSLLDAVQDLEAIITPSNEDNAMLPVKSFYNVNADSYLEMEKKLLSHIQFYLEANFKEFNQGDSIPSSGLREEQLKEIVFLRNTLKFTMLNKVTQMSELKKLEASLDFYKNPKNTEFFETLNLPLPQVKLKLWKAEQSLEKQKKQISFLESGLSDAVERHVDAQCIQTVIASIKEKLEHYQYNLEKINWPLNILVEQRARLELLSGCLSLNETKMQNMKQLLEQVCNELDNNESLLTPKATTTEDSTTYLSEDSFLLSLYKLLCVSDKPEVFDFSCITFNDLIKKAEELAEMKSKTEEDVKKLFSSELKTMTSLENQILLLETLLSGKDKQAFKWPELEQSLNTKLNKINLKQESLRQKYTGFKTEFENKNKLITRNARLAQSRALFVLALTDQDRFKQAIAEIKSKFENSTEYRAWKEG